MRTSLRDLFDHAAGHLSTATATEARQAIGTAAAVLDQLQVHGGWREDWRPGRHTRQLTEELAGACWAVDADNITQDLCRPARLLAVAGDAISTLCGPATPAADRWAISTAVADLVRRCSTVYTEIGPTLRDQTVQWARDRALAVVLGGRHLEPHTARCILDIPIPRSHAVPTDTLGQAVAAAAQLDYRIAPRGALDFISIGIYELRAVALAFTAATELAQRGLPGASPAPVQAYVHQFARHLIDSTQRPDGRNELFRHALQLHQAATRADPHTVAGSQQLRVIANHAANTAASLIEHTYDLAGRVYSYAHQIPVPESQAAAHLRREPFILNQHDITALADALRVAATTSGHLAGTDTQSWNLDIYPDQQWIEPLHLGQQPPSPSI